MESVLASWDSAKKVDMNLRSMRLSSRVAKALANQPQFSDTVSSRTLKALVREAEHRVKGSDLDKEAVPGP